MLLSNQRINKIVHLLLVFVILFLAMESVLAYTPPSSVPRSGLLTAEWEAYAVSESSSISGNHSLEIQAKNIDKQAVDCHTGNELQEDCCIACVSYIHPEGSVPLSGMATGHFFAEISIPVVNLSLPREIRPPII